MAYNYGNYGNGNMMYYPTATGIQNPNMNMNPNYQAATPVQQMPQSPTGINWVRGEAGARAWHLNPGESALLMDSEAPVLYAVSADVYGRPLPMETYDLIKRDNSIVNMPQSNSHSSENSREQYVKMSELEDKITEIVQKAMKSNERQAKSNG